MLNLLETNKGKFIDEFSQQINEEKTVTIFVPTYLKFTIRFFKVAFHIINNTEFGFDLGIVAKCCFQY